MYTAASAKPWFADSYIPFVIPPDPGVPPPAAAAEAMRRELLYDPATTLQQVHTPTLALFGATRSAATGISSPPLASITMRAGLRAFNHSHKFSRLASSFKKRLGALAGYESTSSVALLMSIPTNTKSESIGSSPPV